MSRTKTIVMSDGHKYAEIISRRFLCPKCHIFCMEYVPIMNRHSLRRIKAGQMPRPDNKIWCRNNCHFGDNWGFDVFNWDTIKDRNKVKEWPDEWRERDIDRRSENDGDQERIF